jgi:excisionase family DNA binding protein
MHEYLTVRQAAEQLQVSVRTIYTWLDNGTLPAYKAGGVTRVRADDLESMLKPYPVKHKAAKKGSKGKKASR